jgi:arsenate reductase
MNTVIFACVRNSGRSQMAAAFFNLMADPAKAHAVSAGAQPADKLQPEVVAAMADIGVDISGAKPQQLTEALARSGQWLITLGGGEACPNVQGLTREDWPLADPQGQSVDDVMKIRDQIAAMVANLLERAGWERSA